MGSTGDPKDALTVAQARAEGRATDGTLDSVRYNAYVDSLVRAVETSGKDTILLFVHGGRVRLQSGVDRSVELTRSIEASGYYPLFILWDASDFTTYGWHLGRYRYGRDYGKFWGTVTAPLVLGGDIATAIVRSPWTLLHQGADYCRASMRLIRRTGKPSDASCPLTATDLRERRKLQAIEQVTQAAVVAEQKATQAPPRTPKDSFGVSWARYNLRPADYAYRTVSTVALSPIKLAFGIALDGLGTGAWDDMLRRTDAMFRPERELLRLGGPDVPPGRRPSGAAGVLLNKLSVMLRGDSLRQDSLVADPTQRRYKRLILAGHSMGAIVVNRILREYPELPVARVQYLAAAASISDLESSVVPMLRRRPAATFEHATLHPYAESGEKQPMLLDLFIPRGSLLEWIDNYFEKSRSPFDRRAGKWRNVALGLHIFPDSVRGRMAIKAFGVGDALDSGTRFERRPANHGDFSKTSLRFWCRDFWSVRYPGNAAPFLGASADTLPDQKGCPKERSPMQQVLLTK